MKILLFIYIFIALILIFVLATRKYQNFWKLFFVFGLKGSGKTCYFVHQMIKYKKRGYIIYTDIPVNIPGVRIIKSIDLAKYRPEGNSCIFVDEAGILWDNRNFMNFPPGLTEFYKLQRHFETRVYINSQAWDVDLKIRNLVDEFIFQTQIRNCISVSRPIIRVLKPVPATATADARIADDLSFTHFWRWRFYWMPKYFKFYDSFAVPKRDPIPYREVPGFVESFWNDVNEVFDSWEFKSESDSGSDTQREIVFDFT